MHTTREDWLTAALEEIRPIAAHLGLILPPQIRLTCGLPSTFKRSGATGETWIGSTEDGAVEIMVSPTLADPAAVFAQLLHEVVHAGLGDTSHAGNFPAMAEALHLDSCGPTTEPWKRTMQAAGFGAFWGEIIAGLGDYPHGALLAGMNQKTQSTRMHKCYCPTCAWTFRATIKHIARGLPTCVCGDTFATDAPAAEIEAAAAKTN